MCIQDAGNDETLLAIVDLFKNTIVSGDDIDATKNPHGFFQYMKDYARKNQKNGSYCVFPAIAKKLVSEYLEINVKCSSNIVNLEDFF